MRYSETIGWEGPQSQAAGTDKCWQPHKHEGQVHPSVSSYFLGEKRLTRNKWKKSFHDKSNFAVLAVQTCTGHSRKDDWKLSLAPTCDILYTAPVRAVFLLHRLLKMLSQMSHSSANDACIQCDGNNKHIPKRSHTSRDTFPKISNFDLSAAVWVKSPHLNFGVCLIHPSIQQIFTEHLL